MILPHFSDIKGGLGALALVMFVTQFCVHAQIMFHVYLSRENIIVAKQIRVRIMVSKLNCLCHIPSWNKIDRPNIKS